MNLEIHRWKVVSGSTVNDNSISIGQEYGNMR